MTCDGMDIIAKSISVPLDAKVGDWFCFGGMGAYTYGCRSNFNGMTSTERVISWPTIVHQDAEVSETKRHILATI
jgi:diaminopimelate decarboxylase